MLCDWCGGEGEDGMVRTRITKSELRVGVWLWWVGRWVVGDGDDSWGSFDLCYQTWIYPTVDGRALDWR